MKTKLEVPLLGGVRGGFQMRKEKFLEDSHGMPARILTLMPQN